MNILRTESRVVRPFVGIEQAEILLRKVELKQGNRQYAPGTIILPSARLKEQHFSILLNSSYEEFIEVCRESGIIEQDISLFIYANSRTLRKSTVIDEISLGNKERFPKEIKVEDSDDDEFSRYVFRDSSGFQIYVALVLNKNLAFKPLRINQAGTFLAQSIFTLKPEEDLSSFAPEALTDNLRNDFGLPKAAMTYVYIRENILSAEDLSECITVYLDSDVLNLLLIDESDQLSKNLQIGLAIQTIEAILTAISNELKNDGLSYMDLTENSGALHFSQKISAEFAIPLEELFNLVQTDSSRIRSYLESKFKVQDLTEQLLKRGQ